MSPRTGPFKPLEPPFRGQKGHFKEVFQKIKGTFLFFPHEDSIICRHLPTNNKMFSLRPRRLSGEFFSVVSGSPPSGFVGNFARQFCRIAELDDLQYRPKGELHGCSDSQAAETTKYIAAGSRSHFFHNLLNSKFAIRDSKCFFTLLPSA